MRACRRSVVSAITVVALAVGVTACKHDTLDTGTQGLAFTIANNPSGAGRFGRGQYSIFSIQILPDNPTAGQILGSSTYELLPRGFLPSDPKNNADVAATQPSQVLSVVGLPNGSYHVAHITMNYPTLIDSNLAAPPYATCIDGVAVLDPTTVGAPSNVDLVNPPLAFTVTPGRTTLTMTFNVPGLIAEYQNTFTCNVGCGAGGSNCIVAPFNVDAYKAALVHNLSFK
jgi:hypothetical protein